MSAYYNEIDKFAAQWLRNLIAAGHIASGDVDTRSIADVKPDDLVGYAQCHFFAGIAGWSYALRLAGWPDDRRVWTGSCPCQPFSAAGRGLGSADPRHLWPTWFQLIRQCRPDVVFGEQVASRAGLAWLDLVSTDLEDAGYSVGAADLCAAGVGAPHIRQRLYFVADSAEQGRRARRDGEQSNDREAPELERLRGHRSMADAEHAERRPRPVRRSDNHAEAPGWNEGAGGAGECSAVGTVGNAASRSISRNSRVLGSHPKGEGEQGSEPEYAGDDGVALGDARGPRLARWPGQPGDDGAQQPAIERTGNGSAWEPVEWLTCRDGKARPTEPGLHPLAHGVPGRVGRLRAYGNAIVPQLAAEWITAYMECRP